MAGLPAAGPLPLVSLTTSAAAWAAARAASATAAVAAATAMACLLASKESEKGAEEVEGSKLLLLCEGNVVDLYLVLCFTKFHVFLSLAGLGAEPSEGGGLWCFLAPKSRRRKPMRKFNALRRNERKREKKIRVWKGSG